MNSQPKQISRAQMEKILNEHCPTMSPQTRKAVLTGVVLDLGNGEKYQAPDADDGRATHYTTARVSAGKTERQCKPN